MAKKGKSTRKAGKSTRKPSKPRARKAAAKPRARKAAAKPKKKTAPAKRTREGEREEHYTDLRKVTLAAALKRLR